MISWDSHIIEPRDLFAQVKDGPRLIETDQGCVWRTPGIPDYPLALTIMGRPARYEELDPAGYDPDERIRYQRENGITSEVLFPTFGLHLWAHGYFGLALEVASWIYSFCSNDKDRFACWLSLPEFKSTLHALGIKRDYDAVSAALSTAPALMASARGTIDSMTETIFTGCIEPHERYLIAEAGVGWLPDWCARADRIYTHHRHWAKLPELPDLPSNLVKRHFAFTYTYEQPPQGFDCRWASDFPHFDGVPRLKA